MFIGLLMIAAENDILERVVAAHEQIVDVFYVLDGTVPHDESQRICTASEKCAGYLRDSDLPHPPYPERPVDGYRQALYDLAAAEHGREHWFVLLHGDEVWTRAPAEIVNGADGYILPLPFYFPREGEGWHANVHPLDQLHWRLGPGWPEFRLFRGGAHVAYRKTQHFNTRPDGVRQTVTVDAEIKHYPYRSPDVQRRRAELHHASGFDPDNYEHVVGGRVYWTDQMIAEQMRRPEFHKISDDREGET